MSPFSPLHSLPAEILLEIFGHLPHEDTRTFLQVTRISAESLSLTPTAMAL